MPIYRQPASPHWWVDISANGRRIRRSTGTADKRRAQEYHDRLKTRLWDQGRGDRKPRRTWQEAVVRYLREAQAEAKAAINDDRSALRWLDPYLSDKHLDEIDKDVIARIIEERQKPYLKVYRSGQKRLCKPGADTVNRFLTTFRNLLYKARDEWEWVDRVPKIKARKGTKQRVRWITRCEACELVRHLPLHLGTMAEFSLQTGLRRANVTHLEWSQIDLARRTAWVTADKVKNRKALAVPLSAAAIAILEMQRGEHPRWVFPWRGKPVKQAGTAAWRAALKAAGISDFRWHDLRHTWASWHVQNGTPLHVLQELGGWSSLKMVQRYAHLSSEHLRAWVDRPQLQLVVDNDLPRTGTEG